MFYRWSMYPLVQSVQFSSVTQSCPTLCGPMDCSIPGSPVLHYAPEFAQINVHWVHDAIQPSQSLLPFSPPALNLSQNQSLFQWVSSLYQVIYPILYWSFSISPSSEYSGLISFRTDWFDLLAFQGLTRVLSITTVWKHQFFSVQPSLWSKSHICTWILKTKHGFVYTDLCWQGDISAF